MPVTLFTRENAAQMAHLAAQARRTAKLAAIERETLLKKLQQPTPLTEKEMRVERQLKAVDDLLDDSDDPKEIASLTQAKERLLNMWSLITGHSKRKRPRQPIQDIQPIPVDPQPVYPTASVQPAKPLGWEYD
jgi:hypothetical protein